MIKVMTVFVASVSLRQIKVCIDAKVHHQTGTTFDVRFIRSKRLVGEPFGRRLSVVKRSLFSFFVGWVPSGSKNFRERKQKQQLLLRFA